MVTSLLMFFLTLPAVCIGSSMLGDRIDSLSNVAVILSERFDFDCNRIIFLSLVTEIEC